MECNQCGVCCSEISISSAIPGMPNGKPAGIRCIHLQNNLCNIFGNSDRPAICSSCKADVAICGNNAQEATQLIQWYESMTNPRN